MNDPDENNISKKILFVSIANAFTAILKILKWNQADSHLKHAIQM